MLLPRRKLLQVRRAPSAIRYLGDFVDSKVPRGYRLRIVEREENLIEIGAYKELQIRMALRCLSDGGYEPRIVSWKNIKMLDEMRVK